jgi:hypothetical protein
MIVDIGLIADSGWYAPVFLWGSDQMSGRIGFADQALRARDRSPCGSPPIRVTILARAYDD